MTQSYNVSGSPEIHLDVLKAICGDTSDNTMIDLCCGFAPQTRQLGFSERTYVDIVNRDLAEENDNFHVSDVNEFIESSAMYFDTCFLLDAIEHFPKQTSLKLLSKMYSISEQQIIFTPLGDYLIEKKKTNNPDSHKSGWLPQEFEDRGYATIIFPNFHKTLGIGAFFAFKNPFLHRELKRIYHELNQKQWAK